MSNRVQKTNRTVIKEVDWPKEIRLLVNKKCNYRCSFPDTGIKWCHEDGAHFFSDDKEASFDDFVFTARALKQPFHLEKVKIAGMEPLLYHRIGDLIKEFKQAGYREVSLTTNGYFLEKRAKELAESGLDTLTVSIHSMNPEIYSKITGSDSLDRVLRGIARAKKAGIRNIKINRVMLRFDHVWQDLLFFIDWAAKEKISIKLYELIFSGCLDQKSYFSNYLSWRSLLGYFCKNGRLKEVRRFLISGRERLFWQLRSGVRVETDIFNQKMIPKIASFCQTCPLASYCQEGLFSYGIELNSEMVLSPCLLRDDLSLDVWDLVKARDGKRLFLSISSYIKKLVD